MRRSSRIIAALALVAIAGCAGGGASPTLSSASPTEGSAAGAATSDLLDAAARATATRWLYVGNIGNNSITVYAQNAQQNAAPVRTIAGPNTGISSPGQLSEDAQGRLYVANGNYRLQSTAPAVLVFARGANGNVAPIRTLAGSATGIHAVDAMTVDRSTGEIYVVDEQPGHVISFLRFAANASGNVAPLARSASGAEQAYQLDFDSSGQNLIDAQNPEAPSALGFGVSTWTKNFANNAAPTYRYNVAAMASVGVADDPTTKTYVETSSWFGCNGPCGMYRLAENTIGSGYFYAGGETLTPAPVSVVTSETCGSEIGLDRSRNIYVTHSTQGVGVAPCPADAVYVYEHDASGSAKPLRVLSGAATLLDAPYGIYVEK